MYIKIWKTLNKGFIITFCQYLWNDFWDVLQGLFNGIFCHVPLKSCDVGHKIDWKNRNTTLDIKWYNNNLIILSASNDKEISWGMCLPWVICLWNFGCKAVSNISIKFMINTVVAANSTDIKRLHIYSFSGTKFGLGISLYLHWPEGSPALYLDCPPAHQPCSGPPFSPHCEQPEEIQYIMLNRKHQTLSQILVKVISNMAMLGRTNKTRERFYLKKT